MKIISIVKCKTAAADLRPHPCHNQCTTRVDCTEVYCIYVCSWKCAIWDTALDADVYDEKSALAPVGSDGRKESFLVHFYGVCSGPSCEVVCFQPAL